MSTREGFFSSIIRAIKTSVSSARFRLWGRRVLLGGAAIASLFVAGFCIWLLLPMRKVPQADLLPRSPFAFFSFNLDPESPTLAGIISKAGTGHGPVKNALVRLLLPGVLPDSIVGVIAADADTGDPEILVFVSMGKLVRVLKIFGFPLNKALFDEGRVLRERERGHRFRAEAGALSGESSMRPSAYTIVGNTIVIGTSLRAVKESFDCYRGGRRLDAGGLYLNALLIQSLGEREAVLYVDNAGGKMTALIVEASEKYSFAAFPSIDAVSSIEGRAELRPEALDGSAVFYCRGPDRLEEVKSDVKFLYGALRRVARAADLDMRGDVLTEGNSVRFEFRIPEYLGALFAPSTPEGGEKE
jgi:hypothetical protein